MKGEGKKRASGASGVIPFVGRERGREGAGEGGIERRSRYEDGAEIRGECRQQQSKVKVRRTSSLVSAREQEGRGD